ncbi:MAG: HAD-IIIC family phosphatase [Gammaproteobacteria bacterium]|nr:HAD-IIIC family phosphatase [Gammaproteobacteria bacterium]
MKKPAELVEAWLAIDNRDELRRALLASRVELALPQARKLERHLNDLGQGDPLRLAFVHTYTSELLDPWLGFEAAVEGFAADIHHAPFGLSLHEARADSDLARHGADITVLMLQRTDLDPELAQPLAAFDANERAALRERALTRLDDIVRLFRDALSGQLLISLLPAWQPPGGGLHDAQSEASESGFWAELRASFTQRLRDRFSATLWLDLDEMLADLGRERCFDPRLWFMSRFPFTPLAARALSRRIVKLATALKRPKAKVIALDADNTLWGGIIGEDGLNGIALGPDYPGSLYLAFQRRLLDFQQRGFILALCSKNNPGDLDEVLEKHPHQLLKDGHFAARRVNWTPKPQNLRDLAVELNLGLESFIFVDDSDHECAAVRMELPQVEVVQVPSHPLDVPGCLDNVARLEILALTGEDRRKTAMYAEERKRRDLQQSVAGGGGGLDDYLRSLHMVMRVGVDEMGQLKRLTQLTNKTNQFNLTTRRYDEDQMQGFLADPDTLVAHFAIADSFGDSGVVGLAIVRLGAGSAEIDSFLMSCRVIGRKAESAFLELLLRAVAERGLSSVTGDYLPTAKNALVKDFLAEHGFTPGDDGRWHRDLNALPPRPESDFPIEIRVESTT